MKRRKRAKGTRRKAAVPVPIANGEPGDVVDTGPAPAGHAETGPRLTGGDVDADWVGAYASGEEAVGGSVVTPDQDVVDELGEALGVPQEPDAEFRTSAEILEERDRHRWRLEGEERERKRSRR